METLEKAQERKRILSEGHQLFAELKDKIFKELFDIISGKEDLKISDYCRIGFSEGYLKGYRKAKGDGPPAPKVDNPMPEILPGYVINTDSGDEELTVVRQDPDGYLYYWHHSDLYSLHNSHVTTIREHHGETIWSRRI